jgi:OmpA-OmpF porin, OOP family
MPPTVQQPTPSTAQPAPTVQPPPRGPAAIQQQRGLPPGQPGPATAQPTPPMRGPAAVQQQHTPGVPPGGTGIPPGAQRPVTAPINPALVAPTTQTRDAREFIRRDNQQPAPRIDQLRQERHEVREGNRVFIQEPDRTIIREGDRTIIRHNEAGRFAVGARNVVTERRGVNSETIIERGNGVRIINVTDPEGRLLRRIRRDPSGREIVIIDNGFAARRGGAWPMFVQLPPPVVRIPRNRYILDLGIGAAVAAPAVVYGVLMEPPVEDIAEPYTLDQVRYSAPLRDRMPRVDLDINFETGSWQLTPDQVDRLGVIADAINRALAANPREVFMIEGHTDAVGNDVDNLSLSDRRAEAVAVALTEQFGVPAENLVTQGYGEQFLKVPTAGPEIANRRVAVRRITPLLDQQAMSAPPPGPPPMPR